LTARRDGGEAARSEAAYALCESEQSVHTEPGETETLQLLASTVIQSVEGKVEVTGEAE